MYQDVVKWMTEQKTNIEYRQILQFSSRAMAYENYKESEHLK